MGYYAPSIELTARLSRHNDHPRDEIDNLLYEEVVEKIKAIVNDPQYRRIELDLIRDGIDWQ